jgi:hypothetical protein
MGGEGEDRHGTGWKVPTVRHYLEKNEEHMTGYYPITKTVMGASLVTPIATHKDALSVIDKGPSTAGWLEIVFACGEQMLTTKAGKELLKRRPSSTLSSTKGKGARARTRGKKPGGSSSAGADDSPDKAQDLTGTPSDSLQVVPSIASSTHIGKTRTMSARTLPLYRCSSLLEFPTVALLLYPIEMILNIPPSDRTHEDHIRDSSRGRRFLHVIKRTVESGTVSISQIVWYTHTCLLGSSHVLDMEHASRRTTHHGVKFPTSLSPHHLYRWYSILCDIVLHLSKIRVPTDPSIMCLRLIKTRVSLCIINYRAKKSHAHTSACIDSLLAYLRHYSGSILSSIPTDNKEINAIYIMYSVYHGYLYIGETSTTDRFYTHARSITVCSERQQRVHIELGRLGVHYYDTLIVDFPKHVDRYEHETALIRRFSSAGKYLLNVAQRSNMIPDSKSLQVKRILHSRDVDERCSRMNSRARLALTDTFIRPYNSKRVPVS